MLNKFSFLYFILIGSLTQAQINTEWTINLIDSTYLASTIDDQENIYQVVSYYQTGIGNGISIQKYDKNGVLKWSVPFEIENAFSYELADIVIDNNNNVAAAIIASGYTDANFYVTKYDSGGNQLWSRSDPYTISFGFNYNSSLAVDNNDNIFLSSSVAGSTTGYPFPNPTYSDFINFLIVKYDSSGTEQWSRIYDGPSGLMDIPRDMVIDDAGNVYVTGISEKIDSIDYNNYWMYKSTGVSTIKYNSAGTLEWVDYLPNSDVSDIEIDNSGFVYVVGASGTSGYLSNFMAAKFNFNGNRIWVKNFSKNQLNLQSYLSSVAIDDYGNVFVTGYEDHPTNYPYNNIHTIKYDISGTEEWDKIIENVWITSSVNSEKLKVVVSNSGNVYVHGYLRDEGTGYDGGIIKYDTEGNVLWELIENPTHTSHLKIANSGFLYVTRYNQLTKYRDEEVSEEKFPPTNLSYDFDTHSLRWNKSLSNNVYYYQIFKQQYNPWTNTAGEWISVADSGGNVNKSDSIWVIQTSGFYNYKVGAVFQDTTLFCDSIFVQVGYVLRKRENGKVVAYNFSQDAFTQIRNRDNWPESWYNQFNYNNIFEYAPPILFNGMPDSTYIDWPLFTDIIGSEKAYISQSIGLAGFIPVIMWKNAFAGNYRGSCAGFSMSSLFSFYKNPNYLQQFSSMVDKVPSQIPKTDDEARKVINHLQNTQLFSFPSKLEDEPSNLKSSNANYVLTRLMEIFSNYDNVQLDQYIALVKDDTAGHAVLPFAIRIVDDRPNRYDIYVYDSNAPSDFFPLKIFTDKNIWSYIGLLIDSSASGITLNGPLSSRLGLLSWEEEGNGGGAGPQKINSASSNNGFERTIYVSDFSSVNIKIGNEVVAGYDITSNSVINLDNSLLEFTDGIFRAPKGYVVQNADSKVELLNQVPGSKPNVMFQSDSKNYYVAERTDGAISNETETIDILYEGLNYLNNDNSNKSINLITMSELYDEHKFARVGDLNIFQNDSIGFSFIGNDVNLINTGNSKSYKLNLLSANYNGKKEFVYNSASIPANSTHIIAPNWFNLENEDLLILVDNNRDGSIDDSIYLPNQYEPLPVELSSFTVKRLHNYVRLDWQTSTEINNYGFEIERANLKNPENKVWTKIGFVEGNGNSNSLKNYSFEDKNLFADKYVYRLKQIDNDGTFSYSEEVAVNLNDVPSKFSLDQNFPNPFNPVTQINFSLPIASFVSIKIFNSVGELVKTLLEKDITEGYHSIEWDATNNYGRNLSSGVYYYRIQAGDFVQTRKMLLIK